MNNRILAAIVLTAAIIPSANAESDLYVSGGYSSIDLSDASPNALTVRGGFELNKYIGAEIEGSIGLGSDEIGPGSGIDLEIDHQIGGFLVGRLPVGEQFNILGRVGYVETDVSADIDQFNLNTSRVEQGVALGIGGEYMFTENFGLRGEYTDIDSNDAAFGSIETVTISGVYKFGRPR